jgi:hypothetical protein
MIVAYELFSMQLARRSKRVGDYARRANGS